jgi:hypothetical protein
MAGFAIETKYFLKEFYMINKEFSNCKVTVDEKGILTAVIDLKKNVGLSASGKSYNMGTTSGNAKIPFQDKILKSFESMDFSFSCEGF